jgi:hypothetical protein
MMLKTPKALRRFGVECLHRYRPNGVYYGRFALHGKEIRRLLKTSDRAFARTRAFASPVGQVRSPPLLIEFHRRHCASGSYHPPVWIL